MSTERIEIKTEWGDFGVEPNPNNTGFRIYEKDKENPDRNYWICTIIDNGDSFTLSAPVSNGFMIRNYVTHTTLRFKSGNPVPVSASEQILIKTPHSRTLFARKFKTRDVKKHAVIIGYSDGEELHDALWCKWENYNLDIDFPDKCEDQKYKLEK